MEPLLIESFNYPLPDDRIARFPLAERDAAKLLVYEKGQISAQHFSELPDLLPPETLIVLNDTRVIPVRFVFQKSTGARIELFCLNPVSPATMELALAAKNSKENPQSWQAYVGNAKKWRPDETLKLETEYKGKAIVLEVRQIERSGAEFKIAFNWSPEDLSFSEILDIFGQTPIPPYLKRSAEETDKERYQTVYAVERGSVAAPTAGLHFTSAVFEALKTKGIANTSITLHVGAGTFKPVSVADALEHAMHFESFSVSRRSLEELDARAKFILPAGTTAARTLETLYWIAVKIKLGKISNEFISLNQWDAYEMPDPDFSPSEALGILTEYLETHNHDTLRGTTQLMITPYYKFKMCRGIITNFHQPQSTLLLLISAMVGDDWRRIYDYALHNDFRFLSYGDSSLLWRNDEL